MRPPFGLSDLVSGFVLAGRDDSFAGGFRLIPVGEGAPTLTRSDKLWARKARRNLTAWAWNSENPKDSSRLCGQSAHLQSRLDLDSLNDEI